MQGGFDDMLVSTWYVRSYVETILDAVKIFGYGISCGYPIGYDTQRRLTAHKIS